LDRGEALLVVGPAAQLVACEGDGSLQVMACDDGVDHQSQESRGEVPARVPMGDRCQFAAELEGISRADQPDRGDAHHTATPLPVIERTVDRAHHSRLKGRETGGAWGAPLPEVGKVEQPAAPDLRKWVERVYSLRL